MDPLFNLLSGFSTQDRGKRQRHNKGGMFTKLIRAWAVTKKGRANQIEQFIEQGNLPC